MSLEKKTCSCGWWEIIGLPSKHAARTIKDNRVDIKDYYDDYYSIETYLKVYNHAIHPIP